MDFEAIKSGGPRVLMVADLPFSAVADTLLIPYYWYQDSINPGDIYPKDRVDFQRMQESQKDTQKSEGEVQNQMGSATETK